MMHISLRQVYWALGLTATILFVWLALTDPAFAQTPGTAAQGFSCSGGRPVGELYKSNVSCPTTLSFTNIFSFLICNMEQLSSNLMSSMYCGMINRLAPMVTGALTLAVFFFGIGFTLGVIPATAREFQKFLLKVVFVLVFATQAEYLIGIGYRFLVEGAREGVAASLSGLYHPAGATVTTTGADVYAQLDAFLGKAIKFATDYVGASGETNRCKNAIFAVMGIMAVAFPPLFFLSLLIVVRIAITFLRGVFGYIYAVVGIAFLMTLAPFFLSFYLFQQTRPYFDKWLGYLVSFALQLVIVFAFLTFVVSIDVRNLSNSLPNIVMPVAESPEGTSLRGFWSYCTLCEFEVIAKTGSSAGQVIAENDFGKFIGNGELRCKTPQRPIRALDAVAPSNGKAPNQTIQSALFKFAGTALLSLLVLAYIVDGVLRMIPTIAQLLASAMGANYAPQLGGGFNPRGVVTVDIPGVGHYEPGRQQFTGMLGSFEQGFYDGFRNDSGLGDSITRTGRGIVEGMSRMVTGRDRSDGTRDPGMTERFISFLVNPLGDSRE